MDVVEHETAELRAARKRYPEFSDKLALLMHRNDCLSGMCADPAAEDGLEGDSETDSLCSDGDRAERTRALSDPRIEFVVGGSIEDFEVIDDRQATGGPSEWSLGNGRLTQTSTIHRVHEVPYQAYARRGSLLLRRNRVFKSFLLRAHFEPLDGAPIAAVALVFCVKDPSNYYLLLHEPRGRPPQSQPVQFIKVTCDTFHMLNEVPGPANMSAGVQVEVLRAHGVFTILFGPVTMRVEDRGLVGGQIGVLSSYNPTLCLSSLSCRTWCETSLLPGMGKETPDDANIRYDQPCSTKRRVVLEDLFDDATPLGDLAEVIDSPSSDLGPSDWQRGGGRLTQRSNIRVTRDYSSSTLAQEGSMVVYKKVVSGAVARYRTHIGTADGMREGWGVVFHYKGPSDHYVVRFNPRYSCLRLLKVHCGVYQVLAETSIDADNLPRSGQPVEIWVRRTWPNKAEYRQKLCVCVGSFPTLVAEDLTFDGTGRCGFLVFGNPHFVAEYLQVTVEEDESVPSSTAPKGSLHDMLRAQASDLALGSERLLQYQAAQGKGLQETKLRNSTASRCQPRRDDT